MPLRKPFTPNIDVDMVPLIDIITLILMFLVIVGGISRSSDSVKVRLPRADQAQVLDDIVRKEGRITVSLYENKGRFYAACGSAKTFELASPGAGGLQSLSDWLLQSAQWQAKKGLCQVRDDGTYNIPVKLRIGEEIPMGAVEAAVDAIAHAHMRDVHYAARPQDE